MNKKERKQIINSELRDLDTQEELTKQYLSSITRRKMYLKSELEVLGTSAPTRKGKFQLSNDKKQVLIARLTNGSSQPQA